MQNSQGCSKALPVANDEGTQNAGAHDDSLDQLRTGDCKTGSHLGCFAWHHCEQVQTEQKAK